MKRFLCLIFYFFVTAYYVSGQKKPAIEIDDIGRWPSLQQPSITDDGEYVTYYINNEPIGGNTLVIESANLKWKKRFICKLQVPVIFDALNRVAIFLSGDSLQIVHLGGSKCESVANVQSFKLQSNKTSSTLCYRLNGRENTLIVEDLNVRKKSIFNNVYDFFINEKTGPLTFVVRNENVENDLCSIISLSLPNKLCKVIWNGKTPNQFVFDRTGMKLAFTIQSVDKEEKTTHIWYYNNLDAKMESLTNKIKHPFLKEAISIKYFNNDGSGLFLDLSEKPISFERKYPVKFDLWSYTDSELQSVQLSRLANNRSYLGFLKICNKQITRIEEENDFVLDNEAKSNDSVLLIKHYSGAVHPTEYSWNANANTRFFLFYTKTGIKEAVLGNLDVDPLISPNGKYLLYYDAISNRYFCYNIKKRQTIKLNNDPNKDWTIAANMPYSACAWIRDDNGVILRDRNDLWKFTFSESKPPINITQSIRAGKDIEFTPYFNSNESDVIDANVPHLFFTFNNETKENGTTWVSLDSDFARPITGYLNHLYYFNKAESKTILPVKARNAAVYLVQRESSTESPNFYLTRDFKKFSILSVNHPEKRFNWLKANLVEWNSANGDKCRGLLYKPENFDPRKTYPIIFNLYELKTHRLNESLIPMLSKDVIDIPFYVSQGYVVFSPDLSIQLGNPNESFLSTLLPAVDYFRKLPWAGKIGIEGFSFGGFSTCLTITNTNLFDAAYFGGGRTDLISSHGSLFENGNGGSIQSFIEVGQLRMKVPLWENPSSYVENSAIFNVAKVTTPVLMMFNKKDGTSTFSNGLEFFVAMRRLGKKCWLLQYDNGGHGVFKSEDKLDFTTRLKQFFDHYLMNRPAPLWMLEGIAAKNKGVYSGLDLDTTGRNPSSSPLVKPIK